MGWGQGNHSSATPAPSPWAAQLLHLSISCFEQFSSFFNSFCFATTSVSRFCFSAPRGAPQAQPSYQYANPGRAALPGWISACLPQGTTLSSHQGFGVLRGRVGHGDGVMMSPTQGCKSGREQEKAFLCGFSFLKNRFCFCFVFLKEKERKEQDCQLLSRETSPALHP